MNKHSSNSDSEIHNPKHCYDCFNCKFHWCCGPKCLCFLQFPKPSKKEMTRYLRKYKINQIVNVSKES